MTRHKIPVYRSPVEVLKGHLEYYRSERNRQAIEVYELSIEVLESVGVH
jgi:hypothetical protein